MSIRIVALGKKMPTWVEAGFVEYQRRMPPEFKTELLEIAPATRGKTRSVAKNLSDEAEKIRQALKPQEQLVCLDVRGKSLSTEGLAKKIEQFQMQSQSFAIVIGSADGICPSVLNQSQQRWSLSEMTLPHPLVRIVLMEQLYRAVMILKNHPYHRA